MSQRSMERAVSGRIRRLKDDPYNHPLVRVFQAKTDPSRRLIIDDEVIIGVAEAPVGKNTLLLLSSSDELQFTGLTLEVAGVSSEGIRHLFTDPESLASTIGRVDPLLTIRSGWTPNLETFKRSQVIQFSLGRDFKTTVEWEGLIEHSTPRGVWLHEMVAGHGKAHGNFFARSRRDLSQEQTLGTMELARYGLSSVRAMHQALRELRSPQA